MRRRGPSGLSPTRGHGRPPLGVVGVRSALARVLIVLTLGLIGAQSVLGVARIRSFEDRRSAAEAVRSETYDPMLTWVGSRAEAFAAFRPAVQQEGRRFVLVFGTDLSGDERRTLALVANAYFFPAVAVEAPADANVLVAFGDLAPARTRGFHTIQAVGDGWVGERSR